MYLLYLTHDVGILNVRFRLNQSQLRRWRVGMGDVVLDRLRQHLLNGGDRRFCRANEV